MSGTKKGGQKAAKTNKELHGDDFYSRIGSMGGQAKTSKPKGFAANIQLAKEAGAKGGRNSVRTSEPAKEKVYVWRPGDEFFSK